MRGKSSEVVKLELRCADDVLAAKEVVLHPLMSKRWDADTTAEAAALPAASVDDSEDSE